MQMIPTSRMTELTKIAITMTTMLDTAEKSTT